jgi:TonB family protein
MNPHLTTGQISRCLLGEHMFDGKRHLQECAECGAEVARMESSLAEFRKAVRKWGSESDGAGYQPVAEMGMPFLFSTGLAIPHLSGRATARAGMTSLMMHAAALALAFSVRPPAPVEVTSSRITMLIPPVQFQPPLTKAGESGGGGGGGARETLPASYGRLPKPAPRQFTPPRVDPVQAELLIPPSITMPAAVPDLRASTYGDPFGPVGPPSNGPGFGGGIGSGANGGVGPGTGPGVGPGIGGGIGGAVYSLGGGVSAPVILYQPEPEYSDEARKAKWQGLVLLSVVVDERGLVRDIVILRSLGLGLDEKAIEAVQRWRFRPGRMNGAPVAVRATVEVTFRLL